MGSSALLGLPPLCRKADQLFIPPEVKLLRGASLWGVRRGAEGRLRYISGRACRLGCCSSWAAWQGGAAQCTSPWTWWRGGLASRLYFYCECHTWPGIALGRPPCGQRAHRLPGTPACLPLSPESLEESCWPSGLQAPASLFHLRSPVGSWLRPLSREKLFPAFSMSPGPAWAPCHFLQC